MGMDDDAPAQAIDQLEPEPAADPNSLNGMEARYCQLRSQGWPADKAYRYTHAPKMPLAECHRQAMELESQGRICERMVKILDAAPAESSGVFSPGRYDRLLSDLVNEARAAENHTACAAYMRLVAQRQFEKGKDVSMERGMSPVELAAAIARAAPDRAAQAFKLVGKGGFTAPKSLNTATISVH